MKRKIYLKIHVLASFLAVLTISTFFISSLIAEVIGDVNLIKTVKRSILYALPLMITVMPLLAITGNQLAAGSKAPKVVEKQQRMKIVMINGIVLIGLAIFLFYQSHFQAVDNTFLIAQIAEFVFGAVNLTLIGLNIRSELVLSGRIRKRSHKMIH